MIMNQVNATEIQEHLSDFLDSLTQGETSIVIEKAGKAIATLISCKLPTTSLRVSGGF